MALHVEDDQAPWMAIPKVQFTPVRARTGKIVHATTLATPNETCCGKKYRGWMIALSALNCHECKLAIHKDVRPKKVEK